MKASLILSGCIILGFAACSAPQGKKLASNGTGLAPVAAGPAMKTSTLSSAQNGEVVSMAKNGTLTVTLDSAQKDGYAWRLSEIPDPTVLKVASQEFIPGATPEASGQEKWVFQAVGPGDVDVRMWYGNPRVAPMSGNPTFGFVASVSEESKPEKKTKKSKKA